MAEPRTPPSRSFPTLISMPSIAEPPRLPLSQNEMAEVNMWLNKLVTRLNLPAEDDTADWKGTLESVMDVLLSHIQSKANFIPSNSLRRLIKELEEEEVEELRSTLMGCKDKADWADLVSHPVLKNPDQSLHGQHNVSCQEFTAAYNTPFLGNSAIDFITYLKTLEAEIEGKQRILYSKALPIVQSSGTGKSRMLTEVGTHIFTIPICLLREGDPAYPPGDLKVVKYFNDLDRTNDLSYSTHLALACFLTATHVTMLKWLKRAKDENCYNGQQLLKYWHEIMEPKGEREERNKFYEEVICEANKLKTAQLSEFTSPHRNNGKEPEFSNQPPIAEFARQSYDRITKRATEDLMAFLESVLPGSLCVSYFDEAHHLRVALWVLHRLLKSQADSTRMWHVFMGTKSSIPFYSPTPENRLSARSKEQVATLLPPYIAVGFDQHMINKKRAKTTVCMGYLQSIDHLAEYGRPMWKALLLKRNADELIALARLKLTAMDPFSSLDRHHIFSVLSQRLCLEPVMANAEAVGLAERSVSHHMRLLTGCSDTSPVFFTDSPSEPVLALASADILYNTTEQNRLARVLEGLSRHLCQSGLVEKGILGELSARTLLLISRDFAAPKKGKGRDLLAPVPLKDFLCTLFSNNWAGSNKTKFDSAFSNAYVNFTHWMTTKDPMPEKTNLQLLQNLWARGAALQCCFRQQAVDLYIPIYMSSVAADAVFDPSLLSLLSIQVKFTIGGNRKAESAIRPIGITRDPEEPLPYLTLLMELGNESNYREKSKIKMVVAQPLVAGQFATLSADFNKASQTLESHKERAAQELKIFREQVKAGEQTQRQLEAKIRNIEKIAKKLEGEMESSRQARDSYNRYSIAVRGASADVYQVLQEAKIVTEFDLLLKVSMPSPSALVPASQHMQPLERLDAESPHTDWMLKYVKDSDEVPAEDGMVIVVDETEDENKMVV